MLTGRRVLDVTREIGEIGEIRISESGAVHSCDGVASH